MSQNPLVVRAVPPTTLVRGRTEPEDEGRADEVALLLLVEVVDALPEGFAPVEGLALEEGLPPDDGLALEEGLALGDGELADGADGCSDAGGTFACANGAPPPLERL